MQDLERVAVRTILGSSQLNLHQKRMLFDLRGPFDTELYLILRTFRLDPQERELRALLHQHGVLTCRVPYFFVSEC